MNTKKTEANSRCDTTPPPSLSTMNRLMLSPPPVDTPHVTYPPLLTHTHPHHHQSGNAPGYPSGGSDCFGSTLHFGPFFPEDAYEEATSQYCGEVGVVCCGVLWCYGVWWCPSISYCGGWVVVCVSWCMCARFRCGSAEVSFTF